MLASREPEVRGLLALMLLHHARHRARVVDGRIVPLDEQDRSRWDRREIAEGVAILQGALAEGRRGQFQIEAAIAALHDDADSRGGDGLAAGPRLVRRAGRADAATRCATTRPRC